MNDAIINIGEVVRRTGVPASTLRYYEEIGLIQSAGREGLRRLFDERVIDRLALIDLGRMAGFTLQEILEMGIGRAGFAIDRERIDRQADDLESHVKRLTALASLLRHVAKCPEDDHFNCAKFQKLLRIARRRRGPSGKC